MDTIDTATESVGEVAAESGGSSPPADPTGFVEQYDITVGMVMVEDTETGNEVTMWKAKACGEHAISDDAAAAVVNCLMQVTDGGL